ncbi:MAG: ribose-phosphate pyrophosphokinase-like domain-containing protein, partial [Microbacteriaceae bacterium]|nr:ribose-phosphate pyrophosphokinase-like domain-containing protein [Microbacteriaceae bacterium]
MGKKKAEKSKSDGPGIVTRSSKRLVLVSGRSHPELAEDVAKALDSELLPTEHRTFASGEIYTRFGESVRGCDAFVI